MGSVDPHPARWSREVLNAIAPILRRWGLPVHDPFAGTGERLGELCDLIGLDFTGTEIEEPFIIDPRVEVGNSRLEASYPIGRRYCICTSVVFPNGMTDHFHARDGSRRKTYRQARASITGEDAPLHLDNMGRHGPRQGKLGEERHWAIARDAILWWPARVLVNIKDCILDKEVYPAVEKWLDLLVARGYQSTVHEVATPGMRFGANRDSRLDHEVVIEAYWRMDLGSRGADSGASRGARLLHPRA